MSLQRWSTWTRYALLIGLLAIAIIGVCTGCQSQGGGIGAVASLSVHPSADTNVAPVVLARYDGNTFVGWANGTGAAEVFGEANGFPLYGPVALPAGRVIVHVRNPSFRWEGGTHEALPAQARVLFRESEVTAWALAFQP